MKTGKAVLVTGAAAGIGAGIATRFAEAGYAIALFDIDDAGANEVAAKLGSGTQTVVIEGDVANENHAQRAVDTALAKLGRIDVLVNNAGIEIPGSVEQLTSQDWDRQIGVNLRGVYLMSKYVIPVMARTQGSIVNISSVHAFVSWPDSAAYDATKSGLIGLTRAMALDHGRQGIRVNAICPGYIDTPLLERWLATLPDRKEVLERIRALHAVGRIGTPRDVAEAALFLASEAAAFISGAYLVVDGAMSAAGH
jgi:NAD(P)-dependent dehydrogenase (short-subunit alcohol dehydrogenase family)